MSVIGGGGWANDPKGYPKHATSLTARTVRQRVLMLTAAGAVIAAGVVAFLPHVIPHRAPNPDPGLHAAEIARAEAAAWIADWVSSTAIVGCDPQMCAALLAHGVPNGFLHPIWPGNPDPLDSDVVAATAAIRSQFGPMLSKVFAPVVLASFGSGSDEVDVRVVLFGGSAAGYLRQFRADEQARRLAGPSLLANWRIRETTAAAHQLTAGRVDSRLLLTFAALAYSYAIDILGFGGAGPGASPGVPLLSADITAGPPPTLTSKVTTGSPKYTTARSLAGIMAFLSGQRTPLLPASVRKLKSRNGSWFVRIDFAAPTTLGLLGPTSTVALPGS